jgi:hypothetical protein
VDRNLGSNVDTAFHHVVIVSPAALDVSALQLGRVGAEPLPFDGMLDEVKVFTQPLTSADVNTLFTNAACR